MPAYQGKGEIKMGTSLWSRIDGFLKKIPGKYFKWALLIAGILLVASVAAMLISGQK
jgi:hypothetical protein